MVWDGLEELAGLADVELGPLRHDAETVKAVRPLLLRDEHTALCICLCVCLCVCEREREVCGREGETGGETERGGWGGTSGSLTP